MKNKLTYLLALVCLVPSLVLAQSSPFVRNESRISQTGTDQITSKATVDRYGQWMPQIASPFSIYGLNDTAEAGSTTSVINATTHPAQVGDTLQFGGSSGTRSGLGYVTAITANTITIAPPLRVAPNTGDFFYIQSSARPAIDTSGNQNVSLVAPNGAVIAKQEDVTHTSGDYGYPVWGVANTSYTALAANGDYTPIATTTAGAVLVTVDINSNITNANSLLQREDNPDAGGAAGPIPLGVREDALTQATSANNDFSTFKFDALGRQIITNAPPGETWQSCSASNTGTSDITIKANVASNRLYITDISCFNTAAVASSIVFKDGASQIWVGGISSSTLQGVAYYEHTFTTPLRTPSNNVFNFAMGTTATATTCCAAGYIAVF